MYKLLILAGAIASATPFIDSFSTFDHANCTNDEFFCNNFDCIPLSKQCDGHEDCNDGTDEHDCDLYHCKQPFFFKCKNARCISTVFICDGENDCGDFSDEESCTGLQQVNGTCPESHWQCTNKKCIAKEWVCNGQNDCSDGSDETLGCSSTIPCDGFKCKNGHCIFDEWRCDGQDDCQDNSDEENCGSTIDLKACTIDNDRFLCADGKTCIKFSQVCDDTSHCPDKSDEGTSCWKSCDRCSHHCLKLPTGPVCICPDGYHTRKGNICEDINECDIYGTCDHKCQNTPGSYLCACDENYSLQTDGKTCKAHFGEGTMYFSSKKEIRAYFLRSEVYFAVTKNLKQVVGVDFDGKYVYWTDIFSEHESIVRSLKNGEKRELLVTSGLGAPEDLHVDYITKNIYFTDAERQHIGVCTNDGTHCAIIVNEDIHKPRGIVLNPEEGEMYWTDWGDRPQIARALMDGRNATSFVSANVHWPNGLALDLPNARLYWTDAKQTTIESVRLDGTDRRIILQGIVKHPYAIAVFENRLYWSDWATHSIQSCDKFTGKNHRTLIREQKDYIYGITIYHPNNHKKLFNPCVGAMCSDICLLSGTSYACACPPDKEMGVDNHTCRGVAKKQKLVLGAGSMLMEVEHQVLGKHEVEAFAIVVKKIGALAYNSVENVVYVSDLETRKIVGVAMKTGGARTVDVGEVGQVTAMDFDFLGNNLYWCDSERKTIEVFSFNTQTRTVLLHDLYGEIPEAISLVPEEGVMFVSFHHFDHPSSHVDRFLMDGTTRTHPIEDGLVGPISLCYDSTLHRVFIADAATGNIESTSVEGNDRHAFRSLQTLPIGIASLKTDIFWVNRYSKSVFWADKFNTGDSSYNRKITLDLPHDIDQMHIVSITPRRIGLSPCQTMNGGCSHLCLQSQKKIICACPVDQTLDQNNKTCIKRTECSSNQFFCTSTNTCISKTLRCDGAQNCPNGEDEDDCKKPNHCPLNYYQCEDGECIADVLRCNYHFDCRDKSDERNCSHVVMTKCPPKHFMCKNGKCINERLVCDGVEDCDDREDEENCVATVCKDDEFRCKSGACIAKEWECDHDFDCPDMSDEHPGCPKCTSPQFSCTNGKCIDQSFVCDGENDCGDHSDEMSCTKIVQTCKENEFLCSLRSQHCLPRSAMCNGTIECPLGEDEKSCSSNDCQVDEFECKNNKCIPREWMCDHSDDCGDKSDEESTMCNHKVPHQKETDTCKDMYRCKNGQCIDFSLVCNYEHNCSDGSDEDGVCDTACHMLNDPCNHICVKTPNGPTCKCRDGFYLSGDGKTCEDIDECAEEPPLCGQLCHNVPGFHLCDCYEGFALRTDRISCKAEGKAMSMVFVSDNQIREMSQTENSLKLLYSEDSPKITGLDASSDTIYFSMENSGTIVKINQTSTKSEFLEAAGQPRKLSLDWLTRNIYYVNNEPEGKSISVCNFDDKGCARLLSVDQNRQVSVIAVDAENKHLFYAIVSWFMFNSPSYVLYRTSLDGTSVVELVKSTPGFITGLAFDLHKKELYFADHHQGQLSKVGYDGTRKVLLVANLTRPNGLAFFENQVFFQSGGFMQKCRLYAPVVCESFKFKGDMFAVVQKSKQPSGVNHCQNHTCSFLCVAAHDEYRCLCEDGKVVLPEEGCESNRREAGPDDRRSVLAIHHHEHYSSNPGPVIAGVMISVCLLAFGVLIFFVVKRRNSGTFNLISMRFHNPGYGLHEDDAEKCILEPGQHEYSNPVDFYEAAVQPDPNSHSAKKEVLVNV